MNFSQFKFQDIRSLVNHLKRRVERLIYSKMSESHIRIDKVLRNKNSLRI